MKLSRRNMFGSFLTPLAMRAVDAESAASFVSGKLSVGYADVIPNISRSVIKYLKTLQVQEKSHNTSIINSFGVTYIVDQGGTYEEI